VAKEGEFVAVRIAFFVVEVAGEVPPFGFKLGVGSVVTWKGPGPGREGAGPRLGRMEERGGEGKEKNGEKLFHSEQKKLWIGGLRHVSPRAWNYRFQLQQNS
jgi:hypothetical protein